MLVSRHRNMPPRYQAAAEVCIANIQRAERLWGRQPLSLGRFIIVLANLAYSIGAYIADWNETHVKNPRWPPHARFHNGQTMSLGVCLCVASLYFAFKPAIRVSQIQDNMFSSAAIGTFYCLAGMTAILYPGTDWKDPDQDIDAPQKWLFSSICAAMWIGYAIEMRQIRHKYWKEVKA